MSHINKAYTRTKKTMFERQSCNPIIDTREYCETIINKKQGERIKHVKGRFGDGTQPKYLKEGVIYDTPEKLIKRIEAVWNRFKAGTISSGVCAVNIGGAIEDFNLSRKKIKK